MSGDRVRAVAPGRVNLIGDHTDYMGGLAMPMAIQLATTITALRTGDTIELSSPDVDAPLEIHLPVHDAGAVTPPWGRYVAGVAAQLGATVGLRGEVTTTVPIGSGLSSSAALEVATALALGDTGSPLDIARRCQLAEQAATGMPCGIMDQLAITAGVAGHALVLDCDTLDITPVEVPDSARIWVVHSGQHRELVDSAYAARRAQCEAAEQLVGPLPRAELSAIEALSDPVLRRRARHVRTECARVERFAAALSDGDLRSCGELMTASHASLRDDFEVSTRRLDDLVQQLCNRPGVHGARLTGAGFGGCVVALAAAGVVLPGWQVEPSAGAHLEVLD